MILNLSDPAFRNIFQSESLHLPIRWSGMDFYERIENLFDEYYEKVKAEQFTRATWPYDRISVDLALLKRICFHIKRAVGHYLDGFPDKAYRSLDALMGLLVKRPLQVYRKSCSELLSGYDDKLNLFRAAIVRENIPYDRTRIFHTPYYLRSKVSTCRYSIAGFPSLYLATSLKLCCEEIQYEPHRGFAIASKFKFERNLEFHDTEIDVIELAVKPQDFSERNRELSRRTFDEIDLQSAGTKEAYLLWYPLIAASSFIRTDKSDPFAPEYIVPQLLMQWVRNQTTRRREGEGNRDKLIGIRYFSCASEMASEMGFNYVFPVSGRKISPQKEYCPILSKAFRLTVPHYINEYRDIDECERALVWDNGIDFI